MHIRVHAVPLPGLRPVQGLPGDAPESRKRSSIGWERVHRDRPEFSRAPHRSPTRIGPRGRARAAAPSQVKLRPPSRLEMEHRPRLSERGRARLPDPRPAVAHALGRGSATGQSDDRARRALGEHALRARRALDRTATRAIRKRLIGHPVTDSGTSATRWWWSSTIPDLIRAADRIVDLGPGAGERGGELLYAGPAAAIVPTRSAALTGDYPRGRRRRIERRGARGEWISGRRSRLIPTSRDATAHNLKPSLRSTLPLERLVCVTGVSGSGKSTLVGRSAASRSLRRPTRRSASETAGTA